MNDKTSEQKAKKPGLGSLVKSILAAAIGVQTDKKPREGFYPG